MSTQREVKEIIVGVIQHQDRLLILKRASHNKYDPDRWEFVSAFVRQDDLKSQVIHEVIKETGLTIPVVKEGKAFTVKDEYGTWLIHPFLLSGKIDSVKLDENHTDYALVKPLELSGYDCVAELDVNLKALNLNPF